MLIIKAHDKSNLEIQYLQAFTLFYSDEIILSKEALEELVKDGIYESKDKELLEGFKELEQAVSHKLTQVNTGSKDKIEIENSEDEWEDED